MHPPKKARRATTGILIAFVLLACVEMGLRLAEPHLPNPMRWPSAEVASKVAQMEDLSASSVVDVIFVGSSVVAEGIDPIAYRESSGDVAYNAALSAASMRSMELWVKDVVLPLLRPTTVVIGLTGRDLNDHGISQTEFFERFTNSPGYQAVREPEAFINHVESWFLDNSALIRLRPVLRDPALLAADLGLQDPVVDEAFDVGPFGSDTSYRGEDYPNPDDWRTAWLARHLNDYSIGDEETSAFTRLVETLVENDIEVIVVNMPVTSDYVAALAHPERDVTAFHVILDEIVAGSEVTFLDASKMYAKPDFRDPAHLTPAAATELARELAAVASATEEMSNDQ